MRNEIEDSLRRAKPKKALGRDGVHNEMMKLEIPLMADLLAEVCSSIGRTRRYPKEWHIGLLTLIHKKGDPVLLKNYRWLCMLS